MEIINTPRPRGLVLVTGASGFLGGHCVTNLLEHGYPVRATVRSLSLQNELGHLTEAARRAGQTLEFVEADLGSDTGWAEAVDGAEYVLHVASPISLQDDELVQLPVDGTLRVMEACALTTSVRRVVITSTTDAITDSHRKAQGWTFTEEDWHTPTAKEPYAAGKTRAEKAALDFVAALPDERHLELVTLCPGLILGPIQRAAITISHEPVRRLMAATVPGSIRVGWAAVDVRDVAAAHRLALEIPHAAGQRYILAGENLWMSHIAAVLHEQFGDTYRIPTRELSDRLVRLAAIVDPAIRLTVPNLGHPTLVDSRKAQEQLGWTMRPVDESIRDTAASLVEHGIITPPAPRRTSRLVPRLRPRAAKAINRSHHLGRDGQPTSVERQHADSDLQHR